jgi:DNA-binding transcriptional ArsR family regulator
VQADLVLDTAFSALADPTRRAILQRLAFGEATVNELAFPLPISQPAVSRHLKVLESAGLIERRVEGNRRPCRLAAKGVESIDAYMTLLREAMETNYARLDRLLTTLQQEEKQNEKPSQP